MSDDRYLLVSSDGHTGPPAEHYREYLDERYHPQFDAHQAEIRELQEMQLAMNAEFRAEWEEKTGDGGLLAAYDSDARNAAARQGGRRRRGALPRRRRARHRAGGGLAVRLRAGQPDGVRRRAGDGRGPGPQPVARRLLSPRSPSAASASPSSRSCVDVDGCGHRGPRGGRRGPARRDDPDPLVRRPRLPRPLLRAGVGRRRGARAWSCTPTRAPGPPTTSSGPGFVAIYATEAYWWAARPLWVLLWSGVFERHPDLRYVIAENGAWWVPDIVMQDGREVPRRAQHPQDG